MIENFYFFLQLISYGSKYGNFPVPLVGMVAKAVLGRSFLLSSFFLSLWWCCKFALKFVFSICSLLFLAHVLFLAFILLIGHKKNCFFFFFFGSLCCHPVAKWNWKLIHKPIIQNIGKTSFGLCKFSMGTI